MEVPSQIIQYDNQSKENCGRCSTQASNSKIKNCFNEFISISSEFLGHVKTLFSDFYYILVYYYTKLYL